MGAPQLRETAARFAGVYRQEKDARAATEQRVARIVAENEKREAIYRAMQARLAELQAAHSQQAAVVQQLQERAGKEGQYKKTIRDQQAIIAKLENLLQVAF